MDSATQNPVKLEKTSLAASEHKLNILLADTRIVLRVNLYDEFHCESRRIPQSWSCIQACARSSDVSDRAQGCS